MEPNEDTLEYLRDFDPQTADEVPPGTPFCVYISGSVVGPNGGYVPSVVYENIGGHFPLTGRGAHAAPWEWSKDYDAARRMADEYNRQIGVSPERSLEIVLSSMRQRRRRG
jgi:hypothetical protein